MSAAPGEDMFCIVNTVRNRVAAFRKEVSEFESRPGILEGDTVESEGRQMKQCYISYIKKKKF